MGIHAATEEQADGVFAVDVPSESIDQARRLMMEEFPHGLGPAAGWRPRDVFADPEIAAPARWFGRGTWAVLAVVAVCVAVYVAAHTGPDAGKRSRLVELGAITWAKIHHGEQWRLVTAIFVHFDLAHLFSNMATLLLVAPPVAHILGPWRFLVVFVATGFGGNVLSHEIAPSIGLKAGASGSIAGLLGVLGGHTLRPGRASRFKSWQVLGALAAFYAFVIGFGPGVDNAAHLGGMLTGVVLGRLIPPPPDPPEPGGAPGDPRRPR